MSHLHMDKKKINSVSVDAKNQPTKEEGKILPTLCPNLQTLYLQDNFIAQVGDGFNGLKNLTQINLFNN